MQNINFKTILKHILHILVISITLKKYISDNKTVLIIAVILMLEFILIDVLLELNTEKFNVITDDLREVKLNENDNDIYNVSSHMRKKLKEHNGIPRGKEQFMDDPVAKSYYSNDKYYNRSPKIQPLLVDQQLNISNTIPQLDIFERLDNDNKTRLILNDKKDYIGIMDKELPGYTKSNRTYREL